MSRKVFGEFMEFFPQDLNPIKIQGIFELEFIPNFISWNPVRI
jgi:hypothetical protein